MIEFNSIEHPTKAIHLSEMLSSMHRAEEYGQTVNLRCWKLSTGDTIEYDGWTIVGSHYRGGTHRLRNPRNGQIRLVRDCTIFEYMGREVYW